MKTSFGDQYILSARPIPGNLFVTLTSIMDKSHTYRFPEAVARISEVPGRTPLPAEYQTKAKNIFFL